MPGSSPAVVTAFPFSGVDCGGGRTTWAVTGMLVEVEADDPVAIAKGVIAYESDV